MNSEELQTLVDIQINSLPPADLERLLGRFESRSILKVEKQRYRETSGSHQGALLSLWEANNGREPGRLDAALFDHLGDMVKQRLAVVVPALLNTAQACLRASGEPDLEKFNEYQNAKGRLVLNEMMAANLLKLRKSWE